MIEPRTIDRYRRELHAMTKAATHDPEAFAAVVNLINDAGKRLNASAADLIRDGFSWAEIGRALDMSKQGAHRRFSSPDNQCRPDEDQAAVRG